MDFAPYFWNDRDGEQLSTQVKVLMLNDDSDAAALTCVLNSSVFYWWFLSQSDCRHLNTREIQTFPLGMDRLDPGIREELRRVRRELMSDYKKHKRRKECTYKTTGKVAYDEFFPGESKVILDRIDQALAKHYRLDDAALDFLVNYDIKYRLGADGAEED